MGCLVRRNFLATVGFSIESSNVVGYQNKDVRKGLSQQVCTFDQIGVTGGALDIQRLIPVDSNGDAVIGGEVFIQFYNYVGKYERQFYYAGADEVDDGSIEGWYDDNDEYVTYSLDANEAFQVSAAQAVSFVYSGEVNMAETDVPFRKGLSFQGNIRPVTVDIQSVIPVNDEGESIIGGEVYIQFYTFVGKFERQFYYAGKDEVDDGSIEGWYNDDDEYAEFSFASAQGFKVSAAQAGYLRFPEL